jgi:drug/metabolite transporter (DMT)-like permease
MINWQRTFAFVSGSIVFGLAIILLSHNFIQYVANEGTTGYLFLFGFGLAYLNLNFGFSRRFMMKAMNVSWICYLMAFFTILPTIFWIYTKDVGLGEAQLLFALTTIFSAFLGAYFGIRRGVVKRAKYIEQLRDDDQELPNSLKRPHDDLNIN